MLVVQIDLGVLQKLAAEKLVSSSRHPELPLLIHNYTPICQYERAWSKWTLLCRGLITDLSGNIVARPFPKFFNLDEHIEGSLPLQPLNWQAEFLVTEKMDGSLGILYTSEGEPRIATRGSFSSDQAIRANKIWQKNHADFRPIPEVTYLFEIIYPENRIVVDYAGREELVLLDLIENHTGFSLGRELAESEASRMGCPVVPAYRNFSAEHLIKGSIPADPNREGVVVSFQDGNRVKIKLEEYKRLHRLMTGVNARTVWEMLSQNHQFDLLFERVPDEFNRWLRQTIASLQGQFQEIEQEGLRRLKTIQELVSQQNLGSETIPRAIWAKKILLEGEYASLLFRLLDRKDPADLIWKKIRPEFTSSFRADEEELIRQP
jgi:RNA ligase